MKKVSLSKNFINLLFIIISAACVIPILYIVSVSFTDEKSLSLYGYKLIPKEFSTFAYKYIFVDAAQLMRSYMVTIIVTVVGSVLSLLVTSMLAYTMIRKDMKISKHINFLVFFTMLFNVGLVPFYILVTKYYHLSDTILVLILPYVIIPWNVFLMKGFLSNIEFAIIESAKIDGATEVYAFFKIVIPISKPGLATVGLFSAFTYWNDWWLGMLFISKNSLIPLQFLLYRMMNNIQFLITTSTRVNVDLSKLPSESARMAMCVLAAVPMLFVFPFFQKYFVKGLTLGSVKG